MPNECWCVSAGGNTCGYATNETCDPNECSDRDECPGYGYWCKDAGTAKVISILDQAICFSLKCNGYCLNINLL